MKRICILFFALCSAMQMAALDGVDTNVWYEIIDQGLASDGAGIAWCSYNYQSVDADGKPVTLSAFMRLGSNWKKTSPTITDLDNIVLMEHYTITLNSKAPSVNFKNSSCYEASAPGNVLVIIPDYIGFGSSKDRPQAYLNHRLNAINSYDALVAGYHIFEERATAHLKEHWKLYVAGASQGGGNALAVHRYMEENNLDGPWRLDYSYCCDGPYDPVTTLKTYMSWGSVSYPCVIPMTLTAMFEAYPEVLGAWSEEEFYTDKYNLHKAQVDAAIAGKTSSETIICSYFFNYLENDGDNVYLSEILHPDLFDPESAKYQALMQCLEDNNLTADWQPRHPVKIYYSTKDEIVPYENTQAVFDAFGDQVVKEKCPLSMGHSYTCGLFFVGLSGAFPYNDTPSGIQAINRSIVSPTLYNLQGQRLHRPSSIYIQDGKKIIK